ncbi:MAG: hypothetical protein KI785_14305 [Devosiaceae bacterium]|nr:hypothetical protein [Devosiaceae bacterium MH13]
MMALVDLPAQLQPQMDSARLNVVLTIEGSVVEERSFVLVQHSAGSDADLAGHTVDDGRHAFTYSLAPNDARSLGAIRRAVAAAKQADQRGSLTMGVGLTDLCADDFLPDGPLLVDVFLKTSETGRYVRTLDGYDLRELSEGELVDIMPCL